MTEMYHHKQDFTDNLISPGQTCVRREEEHRSHEIQQHNVSNTGFPILPSDPPMDLSLLSIQPLNCPKEKGEERYESTYLLAFVQQTALSVLMLALLTSSVAYLQLLAPVS